MTGDNLPSGTGDADVDAAFGECFEGCDSWIGGDCSCDDIWLEALDDRRVDAYLDSKEIY